MMNADSSAHCNQKDFYNAYLHTDHPPSSLHPSRVHTPSLQEIFEMNGMNMQQNAQQVPMDVLENLISNPQNSAGGPSSLPGQGTNNGPQPSQQILMEQQMRLNQLQQLYQLQTQIFQQQIELLSGQSSFGSLPLTMMGDPGRARDQQQYLPTPAASAELPPQPSPDFVPPMLLHPGSSQQPSPQLNAFNQPGSFIANHQIQSQLPHSHTQHGQSAMIPSAPHSAPANIVFQNIHGHLGGGPGSNLNSPYGPLPSPAELDFEEMSPLTSPWLGAYNGTATSTSTSTPNITQSSSHPGPADNNVLQSGSTTGMKRRTRTASPSSDDAPGGRGRPSRKRQAALPRLPPPNPIPSSRKNSTNALRGGTKSANSTPIFPPTNGPSSLPPSRPTTRRSVGGTGTDIPGDSPSPVDLSMPPPATPTPVPQAQMEFMLNPQAPSDQQSSLGDHAMETNKHPILPVTPASIMNLGRLGTHSSLAPPASKTAKKGSSRPRSSTINSTANTDRTPIVSPALKPIRPANNSAGVLQGSLSPSGPSSATSLQGQQPPLQVRKTSHKAAEQKRRDSLKTSFDDLRILLPPIPLPSEEGFPDEPILPGAMPPRGPPKGNIDGPNRGVSKLQLLRCGNDYIRRLKGRVERRDLEIDKLRREISRLRLAIGTQPDDDDAEKIELDCDLDACEASLGPIGRSGAGMGDGDDGDEDGGE